MLTGGTSGSTGTSGSAGTYTNWQNKFPRQQTQLTTHVVALFDAAVLQTKDSLDGYEMNASFDDKEQNDRIITNTAESRFKNSVLLTLATTAAPNPQTIWRARFVAPHAITEILNHNHDVDDEDMDDLLGKQDAYTGFSEDENGLRWNVISGAFHPLYSSFERNSRFKLLHHGVRRLGIVSVLVNLC